MASKMGFRKALVLVLVIGFVGFLLLPVIDGSLNLGLTQNSRKKATPQVASSNPLSKAMQLLASIFGLGGGSTAKKPGDAYASLTPEQRAALARGEGIESVGGDYNDDGIRVPSGPGGAYGSAEVQDKDGNWVLVQQQTPMVYSKGMYDSDIKKDPASILEGRRVSDKIAADNQERNRQNYALSPMPLKNMFKKGVNAGISSFGGGKGAMASAGKGPGSASGGSLGTGFGGASGASGDYSGASPMDISDLLVGAHSRASAAAGQSAGRQSGAQSDKGRAETRAAQEQERRENVYESFKKAEDSALKRLQAAAAKEVQANGGKPSTFDISKEYADYHKDAGKEKEKKSNSGWQYAPLPGDTLAKGKNSAGTDILRKWVKGYDQLPESTKQSLIEDLYNPRTDNKTGLPMYVTPKFVYLIKDNERASSYPGGPECPPNDECYWVAGTRQTGPFDEKSNLAGGIAAEIIEMHKGVQEIIGEGGGVELDWFLINSESKKKLIEGMKVKGPKDEEFEKKLSYVLVTTPSNGLDVVQKDGLSATRISYVQDINSLITKDTKDAKLKAFNGKTVESSSQEIHSVYTQVLDDVIKNVGVAERSTEKLGEKMKNLAATSGAKEKAGAAVSSPLSK